MKEKNYAVQMHGITKKFGSFCALNKVSLNVEKGTIHSLLGENGAGKSTLMNILYGLYKCDEGKIIINNQEVKMKNPNVAIELGIGMVHQHFMLVDEFTVTQNIILGNEKTNKLGVIDMKKAKKDIIDIVEQYGLKVNPDDKIKDISVGMQQRVEILKALYRGAQILILDEPTAVLTPQEIDELLLIMKNLIKDGKTIIIITHKLKEIKASSDICTIIRRGEYIDTVDVNTVDENELAAKMVGHSVKLVVDKQKANPGKFIFEMSDVTANNERKMLALKGLSLKVRAGEILGIAGIDGNGQKELVEAIMSLIKIESGSIKVNDKEIQNTNVINVLNNGVSIIHEDRMKRGIVGDFSVEENAILEKYREQPFLKKNIIQVKEVEKFTKQLICDYDIRPEECAKMEVKGLSGGNQQKLIIAREIANNKDLLIAMQPTRGLDVGAIENVHKMLISERDKGKAILLISFELDEVMSVSDTIAVIYDGKIQDTFEQGSVDEKTIGLLMAGGKKNV